MHKDNIIPTKNSGKVAENALFGTPLISVHLLLDLLFSFPGIAIQMFFIIFAAK